MNTYLISDTHFNHANIKTYCRRPDDFTERIVRGWKQTVQPDDLIIHLGDVFIGPVAGWESIYPQLPGRKVLVRGNHDRNHSIGWWMQHGFDFCCDSMIFKNAFLTHEPANAVIKSDGNRPYDQWELGLPEGCDLNIHGHLHNIWDGFHNEKNIERDKAFLGDDYLKRLKYPWQRLFAIEYTNYLPVNFEKFITHPDKYKARGPEPI